MDSIYLEARSYIDIRDWNAAINYGKISLDAAIGQNDISYQIKSHFVVAYAQNENREFGNSLISYLNAAELAEFSQDMNHKKLLIGLYKNISNITKMYKHFDLTHTYLEKALKLSYQYNDTLEILSNSKNLINLYFDEGKLKEASDLIANVLQFPQLSNDLKGHLTVSLGRIMHKEKNFEKAREFYSMVFSDTLNFAKSYQAISRLNYAWTYYDEGNYLEAKNQLLQSVHYCTLPQHNNWYFINHKLLATCHSKLGDFTKAQQNYLKAIEILSYSGIPSESYSIYKDVSEFYSSRKMQEEAFFYNNLYVEELEKHIQEQEEILIQDKKYNMQLLTEKYFDNLKAIELERKAMTNTRNTAIILSSIFSLILVGQYYRQKLKKVALVNALNEIESNSKV